MRHDLGKLARLAFELTSGIKTREGWVGKKREKTEHETSQLGRASLLRSGPSFGMRSVTQHAFFVFIKKHGGGYESSLIKLNRARRSGPRVVARHALDLVN